MLQIYGFIWNYQELFSIIFSVQSKSYKFMKNPDSWIYNFIFHHSLTQFYPQNIIFAF